MASKTELKMCSCKHLVNCLHVIIGPRMLREKRRISISVTSFLNGGGVVIDRTHRMYFFDNSKEGGKKLPVSEICAPFLRRCCC